VTPEDLAPGRERGAAGDDPPSGHRAVGPARARGTRAELLALKFGGGLSNTEIAGVLGLSESNAGTLLHRVVEKLRKACHEQA